MAEHGWTQVEWTSADGAVCASQAISEVSPLDLYKNACAAFARHVVATDPDYAYAVRWCSGDADAFAEEFGAGAVILWNDRQGRAQVEVEKALLLAADRVEFGGDR